MSIILRTVHSFNRPTDDTKGLAARLQKNLKLSPTATAILLEYMETKAGMSCRNKDIAKKHGVSETYVSSLKNLFENHKIITMSGAYVCVNWNVIRKLAERNAMPGKNSHYAASPNHRGRKPKTATAAPALTEAVVREMISVEVKNQMTAMAQRMVQI